MTNGFGSHLYNSHSKTYKVSRDYSLEFTLADGQFYACWHPDIPPKRLHKRLLAKYREARNEFIASLDVPVLVVEI